jgi:hypothetical protein
LQDVKNLIEQKLHDEGRRKAALARLDPRLDPSKQLKDEPAMKESWRALEGSSATDEAQQEMANQWRRIGCAADGAPYVLTALSRNMSKLRDSWRQQVATAFLDPKCAGGRGMSPKTMEELQALSKPAE